MNKMDKSACLYGAYGSGEKTENNNSMIIIW
jgi:hypothetical protein